jgi:hypothetical protein
MTRKILPLLFAAALALPLAAQEGTNPESRETERPATTATTTTAATTTATTTAAADEESPENQPLSARQTREELFNLLQRLPPHVPKALKLDPSLWSNEPYLARYPELAAFAKLHPEVQYHTGYYFDHIYVPGDPAPETPGMRMWNQLMEVISIFTMTIIILSAFLWLIKTILDYRRWSRLSRVHTEVHTKLLDRFGSNEELMAYMNTESGKRFLEAAPIAIETATTGPRPNIAPPINRVLWSVQAGVVLAFAGLGLSVVSWSVADREVSEPFSALGTLALFVGFGFVAAAVISFILSRKLGLLRNANIGDTSAEVTNP